MASLRWILLLAGVIFLIALAAWEKRKPRQAARDSAMRAGKRSEPPLGTFADPAPDSQGAAAARANSYSSWAEGRRPISAPPRIDVSDMEAVHDVSMMAEIDALQALEAQADAERADADSAAAESAAADGASAPIEGTEMLQPPRPHETAAAASAPPPSVPAASAPPVSASAMNAPAVNAAAVSAAAATPRSLMVDWPPESERQIVALRIVAASDDRLSGRAVRLAITACGFVHGRFGIYHQPDADGRALLSIASLSKPGILDPINMDFQRMSGISLFTVLPGPLAPAAALDHLIDTARELSQRLPARVQDEQGLPLDAGRLEDLRDRMQVLSMQNHARRGYQAEPTA